MILRLTRTTAAPVGETLAGLARGVPATAGAADNGTDYVGGRPPRTQRPPRDLSHHPGQAARVAAPGRPVDRLRQLGGGGA
jgi:hypothetical protein